MDLLEVFEMPVPGGTIPTREMIEDWFHRNGYPEPSKDWIDTFFWHPDEARREQHWEAVLNDYELCDFDRWQHFQDVMTTACSWRTFKPIMDALYAEDIEVLDLGRGEPVSPAKEDLSVLTYAEARGDIVTYLMTQSADYFTERGTTKEQILQDTDLLDILASEHMKCVNNFGNEREWSCQDACDVEPGIGKSPSQEKPSLDAQISGAAERTNPSSANREGKELSL